MSFKVFFVTVRDKCVINQVQKIKLPKFAESEIVRYRILFSGRVQHVGFRLEVSELAKRLDLTGFCENLENGDVLAEFQGPSVKIKFLVTFMESLVRIKITNRKMTKLELIPDEKGFEKNGN